MTPKDKAKELVRRYRDTIDMESAWGLDPTDESDLRHLSKECALICAQEIINTFNETEGQNESLYEQEEYWIKVKVEIGIL